MSTAAAPPPRAQRWRFGTVVLDGGSHELTVAGALVRLEPKPLELLLHLLRHPGEVVTKEELHEQVWPGRILSESVLTKTMAKLRQALGDEAQALIKTVHGYGYRLVVPVTVESAGEAKAPANGLAEGQPVPQRAGWRLARCLGSGGHGEVWLGAHEKTGEQRVFKFSHDVSGLAGLKRELTLYRVMQQASLAPRRDLLRLFDLNFESPPYFLESEYVEGGSLPQWLESQGGFAALPLTRRVALAAEVAESLAAAHRAGVLHKDLKPGNILIARDADGQPYVKLADFGSGRMMDLARLEQLEITRLGFTQAVAVDDSTSGTPLYLAPELLSGLQPSVQSDLYALGMVLFQLVVGDFRRPLAPGWERDVGDACLIADISACTDGDPARRLASADELAERLRGLEARHARQRQQAQADEAAQRARDEAIVLRQQLERSRLRRRWMAALAAVLLVALALTSTLLWQVRAARDAATAERLRAEREAARAQAVSAFLVDDVLARANPVHNNGRDSTVRAVLDDATRALPSLFAKQPGTAAAIALTLGKAYGELGENPEAKRLLRQVAEQSDAPSLALEARQAWARLLADEREHDQATAVLTPLLSNADEAVRLKAAILEADLVTLRGDPAAGLVRLNALYPQAVRVLGGDHLETLDLLVLRAAAAMDARPIAEAVALAKQAHQAVAARYGRRHGWTLQTGQQLGWILYRADALDEAATLLRQVRDDARTVLGPEHQTTTGAEHTLAIIAQAQGRYEEALVVIEGQHRQCLARQARALVDEHCSANNLAVLYLDMGRNREALDLLLPAWQAAYQTGIPNSAWQVMGAHNIGRAYLQLGQYEHAETTLQRGVRLARISHPGKATNPYLGRILALWAVSLSRQGRANEAAAAFAESIALLEASFGSQHRWTRKARSDQQASLAGLPATPLAVTHSNTSAAAPR